MIVRRGLDQRIDGKVDTSGLVARELPVVQIRLVHDLRDELHSPVLDTEPPDEGLECAVLTVMPEVRAKHVEGNSLAGSVSGIRKGELGVGITEAFDEPG